MRAHRLYSDQFVCLPQPYDWKICRPPHLEVKPSTSYFETSLIGELYLARNIVDRQIHDIEPILLKHIH